MSPVYVTRQRKDFFDLACHQYIISKMSLVLYALRRRGEGGMVYTKKLPID